ncbi:hypothetical protein P9112_002466 [Eukaryota sp. TZLM1-RC]
MTRTIGRSIDGTILHFAKELKRLRHCFDTLSKEQAQQQQLLVLFSDVYSKSSPSTMPNTTISHDNHIPETTNPLSTVQLPSTTASPRPDSPSFLAQPTPSSDITDQISIMNTQLTNVIQQLPSLTNTVQDLSLKYSDLSQTVSSMHPTNDDSTNDGGSFGSQDFSNLMTQFNEQNTVINQLKNRMDTLQREITETKEHNHIKSHSGSITADSDAKTTETGINVVGDKETVSQSTAQHNFVSFNDLDSRLSEFREAFSQELFNHEQQLNAINESLESVFDVMNSLKDELSDLKEIKSKQLELMSSLNSSDGQKDEDNRDQSFLIELSHKVDLMDTEFRRLSKSFGTKSQEDSQIPYLIQGFNDLKSQNLQLSNTIETTQVQMSTLVNEFNSKLDLTDLRQSLKSFAKEEVAKFSPTVGEGKTVLKEVSAGQDHSNINLDPVHNSLHILEHDIQKLKTSLSSLEDSKVDKSDFLMLAKNVPSITALNSDLKKKADKEYVQDLFSQVANMAEKLGVELDTAKMVSKEIVQEEILSFKDEMKKKADHSAIEKLQQSLKKLRASSRRQNVHVDSTPVVGNCLHDVSDDAAASRYSVAAINPHCLSCSRPLFPYARSGVFSPPLFPRTPFYDRNRSPSPPKTVPLRPHSSQCLYRGSYQSTSQRPNSPNNTSTVPSIRSPSPFSRSREVKEKQARTVIHRGRGFLSPLHVKPVSPIAETGLDGRVYPGLLSGEGDVLPPINNNS